LSFLDFSQLFDFCLLHTLVLGSYLSMWTVRTVGHIWVFCQNIPGQMIVDFSFVVVFFFAFLFLTLVSLFCSLYSKEFENIWCVVLTNEDAHVPVISCIPRCWHECAFDAACRRCPVPRHVDRAQVWTGSVFVRSLFPILESYAVPPSKKIEIIE
jgi:hypothetical protein